jgi:hypothetical protein
MRHRTKERATHQEHPEDGGDETRQVEGPLAANNVGGDTEREGANARKQDCQSYIPGPAVRYYSRKTGVGTSEDQTLLVRGHIHLLAVGCECE